MQNQPVLDMQCEYVPLSVKPTNLFLLFILAFMFVENVFFSWKSHKLYNRMWKIVLQEIPIKVV